MIYREVPGLRSDEMDSAWKKMVADANWNERQGVAKWKARKRYLAAARMLGIVPAWLKLRR
jgi:hypothetical protein